MLFECDPLVPWASVTASYLASTMVITLEQMFADKDEAKDDLCLGLRTVSEGGQVLQQSFEDLCFLKIFIFNLLQIVVGGPDSIKYFSNILQCVLYSRTKY